MCHVAGTLVGVALAGGLHFPGDFGTLRWSEVNIDLSSGMLGFIFGAVSGLFIAGLQAFRLRAWGLPVRHWLLLNALGYGLVHAVADAVPYRPLTIIGGGIIVALCQYLALRPALTRPLGWLPIAIGAWWLGFGLTAGPQDYNLVAVLLLLAGGSGLALKLLLVPGQPPARNEWWARLSRIQRVLLIIGLAAGLALFFVTYALLTGLTGLV